MFEPDYCNDELLVHCGVPGDPDHAGCGRQGVESTIVSKNLEDGKARCKWCGSTNLYAGLTLPPALDVLCRRVFQASS
jgi:transcription elongation factor Elf1